MYDDSGYDLNDPKHLEAAKRGADHAEQAHGKTWAEFLAAKRQ